MLSVLFGLSMDYEVFLVSRMREAWLRTGYTTARSSRAWRAPGGSSRPPRRSWWRFAAFIPSPDIVLKVIGIGMASAIFIDGATVVRMLLVPAVMHLLGKANWWLPAWLDRRLPQLHIEGKPEVHLPAQRVAEREAVTTG